MLGNRIRKSNLLAKKRFKYWYGDHTPEYWMKQDTKWNIKTGKRFGMLRKTNVMCSCHSCRNPRRSHWYKGKEKLTIQERKAPTVGDFELPENEIWADLDNSQFYYDPEGAYEEQYWEDVEWFMMLDFMKEEDSQ